MAQETPHAPPAQLHLILPDENFRALPETLPPAGYQLRTYQPGDEARFFELMRSAGWEGWDAERLRPWQARLLPEGWFMLCGEQPQQIVGSAMALQDACEFGEQGGEIGWVAVDPSHRGKGLGMAISAAATRRLIEKGYRFIHLYTEDYRLAAIKTYLKLGFIPYLYASDMQARWEAVCKQLNFPFTPQVWMQG